MSRPAEPTAIAESKTTSDGAGERLFAEDRIHAAVEAVLLASDKPLAAARIAEAVGIESDGAKAVHASVERLNGEYEETGRAFRIEQVAGGYRVLTLAEFAPAVAVIRGMRESHRLSRAAIETLAIVAYRQPITRARIEAIRGVAAGEVLRNLLEKRLVAIVGRAEELGRPMLYGTSKHFLEVFGLSSVKDLPEIADVFPMPVDATVRVEGDADETTPPEDS